MPPNSCWKNEMIELRTCCNGEGWPGAAGVAVGGAGGRARVGVAGSVAVRACVEVLGGAAVAVSVLLAVGSATGKRTMRGATQSARSPTGEPKAEM